VEDTPEKSEGKNGNRERARRTREVSRKKAEQHFFVSSVRLERQEVSESEKNSVYRKGAHAGSEKGFGLARDLRS